MKNTQLSSLQLTTLIINFITDWMVKVKKKLETFFKNHLAKIL